MVRSGLPQRIITLHPLEADQDILHSLVQGMAHVELSGNVRRRDHDGEGSFAVVHLGVKIILVQPALIDGILHTLRIIGFCHFLFHKNLLKVHILYYYTA